MLLTLGEVKALWVLRCERPHAAEKGTRQRCEPKKPFVVMISDASYRRPELPWESRLTIPLMSTDDASGKMIRSQTTWTPSARRTTRESYLPTKREPCGIAWVPSGGGVEHTGRDQCFDVAGQIRIQTLFENGGDFPTGLYLMQHSKALSSSIANNRCCAFVALMRQERLSHLHVLAPGRLADQPRLADAGLAGHQHSAAPAAGRPRQGSLDLPGLVFPRYQHRAQHLPHATSIGRRAAVSRGSIPPSPDLSFIPGGGKAYITPPGPRNA